MADDVITEIENEIRNNKVMIYMKGTPSFPQCGFSAATIEIFEELGRPFGSVDVLSQPGQARRRSSATPTGRRFRRCTSTASSSAGATSSARCTSAAS